jgi:hypothetical protein
MSFEGTDHFMIHPDTELRFVNETIGMGVFANKSIPKGTITWVRDEFDLVIPASKFPMIPPLLQKAVDRFSYRYNDEYILCWDIARYMNHSCEPSCLGTYDFEIAIRDLAPGEELTDDYSVYCAEVGGMFICACDSAHCRRRILPDDPLHLADYWDNLYLPAFSLISTVSQPLMPLVKETREIEQGLIDRASILTHHQLYIGGIVSQK